MTTEVEKLREELARQQAINASLAQQLKTLQHQMEQMIRRLYGRSSEQLDPNQLLMEGVILGVDGEASKPEPPEAEEAEASTKPRTKRRRGNGRRPLPDHLPRHEIVIDVDESEKVCPLTGKERPLIGYEESEKLEYVPETLRVNVYKRAKYGSPTDAEENGVLTAPLPATLLPRCLADSGLLAHVVVSKFDDHTPLYRIEKQLLRQQVQVSRKTMADWLRDTATGLRPLERRIRELLLAGPVVHHDDTPVKRLDPGAGKTKETRLWVGVSGSGPPLVHFTFSNDRKQQHPLSYFRDYGGAVMCDEYAGYRNIDCTLLQSCWAHARRHVERCKTIEPAFAAEVLLEIAALYRIEQQGRELTPDERTHLRQEQARPQLDKLFTLLESRTFRPASPMQKAIHYVLSHREGLSAYVEDGGLPIDNNPAERAIRRVAVGRKNWLFLGSETGGETAATLMSLLGTCWANRLNAFAWLRTAIDTLPTLPEDRQDELLPHVWAEAHPEHRLPQQG